MSARKGRRPPRRTRSSGAVASPQPAEAAPRATVRDGTVRTKHGDYEIITTGHGDYEIRFLTSEDQRAQEPVWPMLHFSKLTSCRERRKQMVQRFIDKEKRTPRRKRRWFHIKDIEPDQARREKLLEHWRASLWSGDLMLRGKSQVLCLSASRLMENNRLPPGYARDEKIFYIIVDDLWMSVPRWLQWFGLVEIEPPKWMSMGVAQVVSSTREATAEMAGFLAIQT